MFQQTYPGIAKWVEKYGWVEIGPDVYSTSLIRLLDVGGMIWESDESDTSLDAALIACEQAINAWLAEND